MGGQFGSEYITITATLPNFGALFSTFTSNINQIQVIREQQETDKTGIAVNKDQLRADLVANALDVSRKTEAYAKMTNNAVLEKEVHYSESDLKKAPDTILKDRALLIHDKANANLTALETYGVTADVLTALKNGIDLFNASIPNPRLGITEKKQATDQLEKLFKANDVILEKFDTLVEVIRLTQPVFYAAYKDNRKVVETGIGTLAVKGFVTDAETGAPIKGVSLSFALDGNGTNVKAAKASELLVKKTADKGGFNIKSLPAGMYKVTIMKNGYADQVTTVAVSDGEMSELNVQLTKN
jgi:hypothetical protein